MAMVHVIIASSDPSIRYNDEYTFQVAILFGDTKKDFDSYLRPIIESLDRLSREPVVVRKNGVHVTSARIFNLGVIADGIEINQRLLMFSGHTNWWGCRFCIVKGGHPVDGGKGGMYFFGRDSAIRTKTFLLLEKDAPPCPNHNYGIKSASPFGQLSTLLSIDLFMCDELHMCGKSGIH
ncbi:hypothetical protein INT47_005582 [Mucor saturninus]|uniref:Uncharacterized protein n=1 Tax=Mucor saturninus TaxID=64648 RepID=A0A8H7RF06_9FUNG|nr:hypothetical protein INT47_005582 [Mucor saturninus]